MASVTVGCRSSAPDARSDAAAHEAPGESLRDRGGDAGAMPFSTRANVPARPRPSNALPERVFRLRSEVLAAHCPAGMVHIPATKFKMGSIGNESAEITGFPDWDEIEKLSSPAHEVSVAAFCIDTAPVTVAEYQGCVTAGACREGLPNTKGDRHACNWKRSGHEEHPMDCVDWPSAAAYCARDGRRLPWEREWEVAARGTDGRVVAYGKTDVDVPTCKPGGDPKELELTCPIASFPLARSAYGLYDMAYAPSEWTGDVFCKYPSVKCSGHDIAVRGGMGVVLGLTFSRQNMSPEEPRRALTFRCAKDPD